MKNLIVVLACLCTNFSMINTIEADAKNGEISFFQTNLVCGAASDIGCGTRAKPILLEFMRNDAVKEALLNHAGTVIAVVWNEGVKDKHDIANKVFSMNDQPFFEVVGASHEEQLLDFQKGSWYKGKEVDDLTVIEAARLADQMTSWVQEEPGFTAKDQVKLKEAFEKYIKKSLLAIEDATIINETSYWRQWEEDLTTIGKELVGDKMPDMQLVRSSAEQECTSNKNCCTDKSATKCCQKSNK